MIITYKKGLELNGKNPTILYGYGGFNVSLTPSLALPMQYGWNKEECMQYLTYVVVVNMVKNGTKLEQK